MNLFKRFEIWLLLLLAVGVTAFVFWQDGSGKAAKEELITGVQPAKTGGKTTILRCTLERDFGNARLDIEVRMTNRHAKQLLLVPPAIRLTNAADKEVPPYILPVEPPPVVPPQAEATVKLRFWLEKADLAGKLTLEVDGERFEIKEAKPLDLEKLKNGEPKVFQAGAWGV